MMFPEITSLFAFITKILRGNSGSRVQLFTPARRAERRKNPLKVVRFGADGGGGGENTSPAISEQICSLGIN